MRLGIVSFQISDGNEINLTAVDIFDVITRDQYLSGEGTNINPNHIPTSTDL